MTTARHPADARTRVDRAAAELDVDEDVPWPGDVVDP